ncbi:MAG: IPT/TIG domain-containing protein [Planctomycetes bacterium]|nr:IPT/TIG domain-containing protein [Planctomycetota bacterium]
MISTVIRGIVFLVMACMLTQPITSQAASAQNTFLVASHQGGGGITIGTQYRATLTIGAVPVRASTTSTRFAGSFGAILDVARSGGPWLTGIAEGAIPPRGGTTIHVHGADFLRGGQPTVTIDGLRATITAQTNERLVVTVPFRASPISTPGPGRRGIVVQNAAGSSNGTEAVHVLPSLRSEPAAAPLVPFDIVFEGHAGDVVVWFLSPTRLNTVVPIPGMLHGLELDPSLLVLMPPVAITEASGIVRVAIPALAWSRPLLAQALVLSTDPGYGPQSFTNVTRL